MKSERLDIEAIRARHLRPEQMEHRTFYEGHIVIDLANALEEIERLRMIVSTEHADWRSHTQRRKGEV